MGYIMPNSPARGEKPLEEMRGKVGSVTTD